MHTRAIFEIQSDAMKLLQVQAADAVEACDWVALGRISEQLADMAHRGLYHSAMSKQSNITQFALGMHYKTEIR